MREGFARLASRLNPRYPEDLSVPLPVRVCTRSVTRLLRIFHNWPPALLAVA